MAETAPWPGRGLSTARVAAQAAVQVQIGHPASGHVRWRIVPFAGAERDGWRWSLRERGREVLGEENLMDMEFVGDVPRGPQEKAVRVVAGGESGGRR